MIRCFFFQVFASDGDASSPNNAVTYRIRSGARDKFSVDPDSGLVSVSPGASLDPDLPGGGTEYRLELAAVDGGIGTPARLSGTAEVVVTVIDINNKPPVFVSPTPGVGETVTVSEDANAGHFLTRLVARDPDVSSRLRYSVDFQASEAFNEDGRWVNKTCDNPTNIASMNLVVGCSKVFFFITLTAALAY